MKFTYAYTYQSSYFTRFLYFGWLAFLLLVSFYKAFFIVFAALFAPFLYYQLVYLKNKLMVGVNREGVCIWQRRNQYLFCPWKNITKIEVRKYSVNHRLHNYLYIEYQQGAILTVSRLSTYVNRCQEVDLEVLSTELADKKSLSFYIPFHDIKGLEGNIRAMPAACALLDTKDLKAIMQ
ncbi:MAG: hypothetical protein AB7F19_02535 [Candidatus Babeliales bacterium]